MEFKLMRGWKLWLPLLGLIVLSAVFIYGLSEPKDDYVQSQMVGKKLPDFVLPAAMPIGQGSASSDLARGRPRLLNIFASWCLPCAEEASQLESLRAQGAEIYGIAVRDTPTGVAEFLKKYGNPFSRIGADQDMRVQLLLGSTSVPETYVISGDGIILYQHIGDIRPEHVQVLLAKLATAK
jgi:cytochrome c biogenesis protein CcmG, thiol:disulfide interchange protein DsbE